MQKYGRYLFSTLRLLAAAAVILSGILLTGSPIPAKADEGEDASREMIREMGYALESLADERDIMGVVYLCTEYSLRQSPSRESDTAMSVPCGQTVTIQGFEMDAQGKLWLKVRAQVGTLEGEGWMERRYLACSDERFLSWESILTNPISLLAETGEPESGGEKDAASDSEVPEDILQFPQSYREALIALKKTHPNWIFVPMNTGLDWEEVINEELKGGKSLVHRSLPECTKEGVYDQGNWFYASREVLERYMDPRNSLTEDTIFQFEQLTYNESYHTQKALKAFLDKTFMNSSKNAPGTAMTYDLIIWAIGKEEGREVSPFHLAARIYQEQGQGTSPLISGTYPGYEGYYNYFNIGASGTTNKEVIENGLAYAKKQGWKDAYYSILGGADVISGNYIKRGQDTLYLQKYNVNPGSASALYTHQYMQNISAPTTEASKIRELYHSAEALTGPFVFKIPTFENMPKKPCAMPKSSTNVVLQIPSGYTGTEVIVDGTVLKAEKRNGRLIATLPDAKAKKAEVRLRDAKGKLVQTYCWDLTYASQCYTAQPWPTALSPASVILDAPEGFTESNLWLDGIKYDGVVHGQKLIVTAPDKKAKTAVLYRYSDSGVPVDMYVWTLNYQGEEYTAVPQPKLQGLLSYHGFSIRITGRSGIRVKSGIATEKKEMLCGEGVDGYCLKEYGTLVMTKNNMKNYPMIKGGEKIVFGMSYGREEDGTEVDTVYETVDGRSRFTGVLVGLPAEQYKTEFAFRPYLILEKDGAEMILYGAPVTRSIYDLAQQALDLKLYESGSAAYEFLNQLMKDADALEQ